jgi:hypothetical protein
MMVTPVHDPNWVDWSSSCSQMDDSCSQMDGSCSKTDDSCSEVDDAFTDYKASGFTEYLGRGWCRLEMFLNANAHFDDRRDKLFGGELRQVMSEENRRPHLLFGTREMELGAMPLILRALRDFEFAKYHPSKGAFTNEDDAIIVGAYVDDLFKLNTNLKVCSICCVKCS